jgi:hypothetical protein
MNPPSSLGCVLMLVVPALLVVSTYLAWWELRFLVQGRTTDAVVNRVEELEPPRHRTFGGTYLAVHYSFQDELTERLRTERDKLPLSWPRPGGTIRIQYVAGLPGSSRVEGHRHVWSTVLFVVCVIGSSVYVGLLLRGKRGGPSPRKRPSKRGAVDITRADESDGPDDYSSPRSQAPAWDRTLRSSASQHHRPHDPDAPSCCRLLRGGSRHNASQRRCW